VSASQPSSESPRPPTSARLAWVWLAGPTVLLLFTVAVLGIVLVVATYPDAPRELRAWESALTAVSHIGEGALKDFLGIAAVVAAFIIASATATGFGRDDGALGPITRQAMFATALIGALLLVGLAALGVPVALKDPSRTLSVLVNMLLAWMALLTANSVARTVDRATEDQRLVQARARAEAFGIALPEDPSGRVVAFPIGRVAAQFLIPLVVWLGVLAITLWVARIFDATWWPLAFNIGALAYFLNLALSLVWCSTADLSSRSGAAAVGRAASLAIVGLGTAGLVYAFHGTVLSVIGWTLGAFTVAHAVVLFFRTHPRMPGLDAIEASVTQRSLLRRTERLRRSGTPSQ